MEWWYLPIAYISFLLYFRVHIVSSYKDAYDLERIGPSENRKIPDGLYIKLVDGVAAFATELYSYSLLQTYNNN